MAKQEMKPPETWNDEKTIRESFHMWFGWYGWKDQRAARGAFRRGFRSGAFTATVAMWHWIQEVVYGKGKQMQNAMVQKDTDLPDVTEKEQKALDMIIEIADWLSGSAEAAAAGQPEEVLSHACKAGAKYLESIGEYLQNGNLPAWYEDPRVE